MTPQIWSLGTYEKWVSITKDSTLTNSKKRSGYLCTWIVEVRYDVRSIVVGDEVFSFAIHSQETKWGETDFRTAAVLGEKLRHEAIDLGTEVNNALVAYTKSFGLALGAIDLIITKDDRVIFLEDNPNGQWGWLEETTGVSISMAFARYLAERMKM